MVLFVVVKSQERNSGMWYLGLSPKAFCKEIRFLLIAFVQQYKSITQDLEHLKLQNLYFFFVSLLFLIFGKVNMPHLRSPMIFHNFQNLFFFFLCPWHAQVSGGRDQISVITVLNPLDSQPTEPSGTLKVFFFNLNKLF